MAKVDAANSNSHPKSLKTILELLTQEKSRLFADHKIRELGIFGSYTRSEEKEDSDLDILVDYIPDYCPSLLKFISLENRLTDMLGIKVDLVMKDGIREEIKPYILKDIQYI